MRSVRTAGAECFAGTTVANTTGFTAPIPFAPGQTTMSVRVWSPLAGVPVRFKVEKFNDSGISVEAEVMTTVAESWETLVYDFVANKVPGTADINFNNEYTKASIFFNFQCPDGTPLPEQTYFWDDVEFGSGSVTPTTVYGIISNSPDHTTLASLIDLAMLDGALSDPEGTFTVFAPNDAAFASLPIETVAQLTDDPTGLLAQTLLYHVLGSVVLSTDLSNGQQAATLQGENITVTIDGLDVLINNALVLDADLMADNGVVHVIDAVLLPSILSVSDLGSASNPARIAPNPADAFTLLQFEQPIERTVMLTIYDLSGKAVKMLQINQQQTQISTTDLKAGLYLMSVQNGVDMYFQKLMVTR